jgi:hypothetical protein
LPARADRLMPILRFDRDDIELLASTSQTEIRVSKTSAQISCVNLTVGFLHAAGCSPGYLLITPIPCWDYASDMKASKRKAECSGLSTSSLSLSLTLLPSVM